MISKGFLHGNFNAIIYFYSLQYILLFAVCMSVFNPFLIFPLGVEVGYVALY